MPGTEGQIFDAVRSGFDGANDARSDADGVQRLYVPDFLVELDPSSAREDDVRFFAFVVAVCDCLALPRFDPHQGQAGVLGIHLRKAHLLRGLDPECRGHIRCVAEVHDRVLRHGLRPAAAVAGVDSGRS